MEKKHYKEMNTWLNIKKKKMVFIISNIWFFLDGYNKISTLHNDCSFPSDQDTSFFKLMHCYFPYKNLGSLPIKLIGIHSNTWLNYVEIAKYLYF